MQTINQTEKHSPKSVFLSLSSSTAASASMVREAVEQVNRALQTRSPAQDEISVPLGSLLFSEEILDEVLDTCHQAGYQTRYSIHNHECTLMLRV